MPSTTTKSRHCPPIAAPSARPPDRDHMLPSLLPSGGEFVSGHLCQCRAATGTAMLAGDQDAADEREAPRPPTRCELAAAPRSYPAHPRERSWFALGLEAETSWTGCLARRSLRWGLRDVGTLGNSRLVFCCQALRGLFYPATKPSHSTAGFWKRGQTAEQRKSTWPGYTKHNGPSREHEEGSAMACGHGKTGASNPRMFPRGSAGMCGCGWVCVGRWWMCGRVGEVPRYLDRGQAAAVPFLLCFTGKCWGCASWVQKLSGSFFYWLVYFPLSASYL